MKKVHLLTITVALVAGFVAQPKVSGHEGIGNGHTDYNGNGWGHIKHGDGGCTYCSANGLECACEPPCVPPCDGAGSPLSVTETDLVYEVESRTDDILLLLEYWDYLGLYWEPLQGN